MKKTCGGNHSSYINTLFILPTSNDVERVNSFSKRLWNHALSGLNPSTLDALIFLKENKMLWNLTLIAKIVNDFKAEEENQNDFSEGEI